MEVLFESSEYRVEFYDSGFSTTLICFSNWSKTYSGGGVKDFKRRFGLGLNGKIDANVALLITSGNYWYTGNILPAIDAIVQKTQAHRVITYGSSMGGYAAINLSERLGADFFVAISPQFSVSARYLKKIGEKRWQDDTAILTGEHDYLRAPGFQSPNGLIIFDDQHRPDRLHAKAIKRVTGCQEVAVPYAGHLCGKAFNKLYGLKRLIQELIQGGVDFESLSKDVSLLNRHSLAYMAAKPEFHGELKRQVECRMDEVDPHVIYLYLKSPRRASYPLQLDQGLLDKMLRHCEEKSVQPRMLKKVRSLLARSELA